MTDNQREKLFDNITKIFSQAVTKAQKNNHKKGLPNVYSINGHIVKEYPDGKLKIA